MVYKPHVILFNRKYNTCNLFASIINRNVLFDSYFFIVFALKGRETTLCNMYTSTCVIHGNGVI